MQCYVRIDHARRGVLIRAEGQWTMAEADRYYDDMSAVLAWARGTGRPIKVLADLDGLILHTAAVSRRIEDAVEVMRQFPLDRYALIVPSFLMRMQCRRLLDGIPHSFFDDRGQAADWLRWEPDRATAI